MFSETNTKSNRFISRTLERPIVDLGTVSGTVALDLNDGTFFRMKLIGNINIVLSSSENASFENINLEITNENFGITWPKEINLDSNGGQYTQLIAPYTTSTFVLTKSGKNSFAYDVTNIIQKSIKATPLRPDSSTSSTIYCKFILNSSQSPPAIFNNSFCCCSCGFAAGVGVLNPDPYASAIPCFCGCEGMSSLYVSSYTRKYHLTGRYMTACICCYGSSPCICIQTNLILATQCKDNLCFDTIYGGSACGIVNSAYTVCQYPVGIDDDKNIFYFCCASLNQSPTIFRTPVPEITAGSSVTQLNTNLYGQYYYTCSSNPCTCLMLPTPIGYNWQFGKVSGWSDKCTFVFTTMTPGVNSCCCSTGTTMSVLYRNICPTSYPACYVPTNGCTSYTFPPLTVTNKKGYYLGFCACGVSSCCGVYYANVSVWCDTNVSNPTCAPCLVNLTTQSVYGYYCGSGCCQNSNFGGATMTCDGCYLLVALVGNYACMCANGLPQSIKVYCKCASNPCFCSTPTCFTATPDGTYCCLVVPCAGITAESCCYTERSLAGAYFLGTDSKSYPLCFDKANTCWKISSTCGVFRCDCPINTVNSINHSYFNTYACWPNWIPCNAGTGIAGYSSWTPWPSQPGCHMLYGTNYPATPVSICSQYSGSCAGYFAYDMSTPRSEDR